MKPRRRSEQLDREIAETLARRAHSSKRQPYIPNGRSKGRQPKEFDPVQLRRGTKVEMEHTNDRKVAQRIAMDHLVEDPLYYVKLARVHID